jgi:hypothetical protein
MFHGQTPAEVHRPIVLLLLRFCVEPPNPWFWLDEEEVARLFNWLPTCCEVFRL